MMRARGLALLALVAAPVDLEAQVVRPLPPRPRSPALALSYPRANAAFTGFWTSSFYGFSGYPAWPVAPFPAYPFWGPSVEIVYQPPPVYITPPVVINQPIVIVPPSRPEALDDDRLPRMAPGQREPVKERVRPAPEKPVPPRAAPREIVPPPAAAKPAQSLRLSRSDRLLALGQQAFAEGFHGRAERFFATATAVPPVDPLAYFYLGQARFARAEYQEAVASIEGGLRIMPEWVRARFRADELYGPHPDVFKEHLGRLEETLARHPADPHLLFLHGYQLWFSGRQDEARTQFQRAAKAGANPVILQLFLNARIMGLTARK